MRYFGNNIKLIVNNLMVNYTDQGPDDAPAIIFIHGFPLNKTMWDKQVNALKENYRVITYDIRGHGESESGISTFSIELFVSDLLYLMDALKIEKASVCGLSMGGYIALNAITNYPQRFESLVLCDTNCIADSLETIESRIKTSDSISVDGINNYAEESVKHLFALESFTTHADEIDAVKEMIQNTSEETLIKTLMALCVREQTCSLIHQIKVPTLILVGEEDKITPPAAAKFMHAKIPNSILHVIDHAGHLSNMENPVEFNKLLKTFFGTVYKEQTITSTYTGNSILSQLRYKLNILLSI
jgi:3-oxoadipate enol-lactonase